MHPTHPDFILWDTEFTSWEGAQERNWSGPNEARELVQLGALLVDGITLQEKGHLSLFARPVQNPTLSDYFCNLTGISQADLNTHGQSAAQVVESFYKFSHQGQVPCFSFGNDYYIIEETAKIQSFKPVTSAKNMYDLRQLIGQHTNINVQNYSSGTLHQAVGVSMAGQVHNALFDCRSMLATLQVLQQNPCAWIVCL